MKFVSPILKLCHHNVDICHLKPEPLRAKSQTLLLLCRPRSYSPYGGCGLYKAHKVKRAAKKVVVTDTETKKLVCYDFNECVRLLEDDDKKYISMLAAGAVGSMHKLLIAFWIYII